MVKIACLQLTSGTDLLGNIKKIENLVASAVAQGAEFIVTPENTFLMEENGKNLVIYNQDEHPAVRASADMARKYGVWLLIGSVLVAAGNNKSYNRSLLFNPQGELVVQYDKIHLFDVEVGDGQVYRESARIVAGDKAVIAKLPFAKLGLTICYDLRFPKLYRTLAKAGASIITVPAAFTQVTGQAHWHVLLRARAIETGCFIIAPAQTGIHENGRKTYGHSLIVSPWGEVVADAGIGEGVIIADIDLLEVENARAKLPSLEHDRDFITNN